MFTAGISDAGEIPLTLDSFGAYSDVGVYKDGAIDILFEPEWIFSGVNGTSPDGKVIGYGYREVRDEMSFFLYDHGNLQDITAAAGNANGDQDSSAIFAINNAGQFAGNQAFITSTGFISGEQSLPW